MQPLLKKILTNTIILSMLVLTVLAPLHLSAHFQGLAEWSETVFKNLPEYSLGISGSGQYPAPLFTAKEFQALADDFVSIFRDSSFNQDQSWLNNQKPSSRFFIPLSMTSHSFNSYHYAYVQRKTIKPSSQVCFIGDIHGSIHSVLRILWRLVQLGKLDNNLTIIDPNFYMVFNGDFVDRGRYGIEVWYSLMHLKKANKDQVFLLRGNHEDIGIQSRFGFAGTQNWRWAIDLQSGELYSKFRNDADRLRTTIDRLCSFLPHALYLGSGCQVSKYYFQCCHGGIETGFNPTLVLTSSDDQFQLIAQGCNKKTCYEGFNWSDFCQHGDGHIHVNDSRGAGYIADVVATQNYLDSINNQLKPSNTSLVGFMRGHQDMDFGLKMLFKPEKFKPVSNCCGYKNGPYHWTDVVTFDDQKKSSLGMANYVPVFTFSTATEGQGVGYDCFGIMTMGTNFEQCILDVYEIALDPHGDNHRNNKFVSIKPSVQTESKELITISWTRDPVSKPIDTMLAAKASEAINQ